MFAMLSFQAVIDTHACRTTLAVRRANGPAQNENVASHHATYLVGARTGCGGCNDRSNHEAVFGLNCV